MKVIPRSARALVALGTLGIVALSGTVSFHLLFFYTDVAHVPARTMGIALLISRLWDMINDPLAGWLSDRTQSRWGRRRIYLILSALPIGVASGLLWFIPTGLSPGALLAWVVFTYFLFDGFFTLASVPLNSLVSSLSDDYDQRTSLAAWVALGAWGGYLLGSAGMPFLAGLAESPRVGFPMAGGLLGVLAAVGLLAAGLWLKEPPAPPLADKPLRFTELLAPFKNHPFRFLLAASTLARLSFTVLTAGLPYFVTHWMKEPKWVAAYTGYVIAIVGIFLPVWNRLAIRWEKGMAYALGIAITGAALILFWWIPPGPNPWVWVLGIAVGVGLGAHWVTPTAMMPDAIDWDQLQNGVRRDGAHFGIFGTADKLARTLGILGLGWGLAAVGYTGGTPSDSAMNGFRFIFGPANGIVLLAAAGLMTAYPLTRARQGELRAKIERMEKSHSTRNP